MLPYPFPADNLPFLVITQIWATTIHVYQFTRGKSSSATKSPNWCFIFPTIPTYPPPLQHWLLSANYYKASGRAFCTLPHNHYLLLWTSSEIISWHFLLRTYCELCLWLIIMSTDDDEYDEADSSYLGQFQVLLYTWTPPPRTMATSRHGPPVICRRYGDH